MTIAYVLINCELGAEESIMEKLKEIEQAERSVWNYWNS